MAKTDQYLLGFQDGKIKNHQVNYQTNKIGGKPDWIHGGEQSIFCQRCGTGMTLVVQLYCPLAHIPSRTLYVFVCLSAQCRASPASWRAVRCQGNTQNTNQDHHQNGEVSISPAEIMDCKRDDELTEGVQALHISPHTPSNETSHARQNLSSKGDFKTPCFKGYFIFVEEEVLEKIKNKDKGKVDQLYKDYIGTKDQVNEKSTSSEGYEKATAKHGDRITQKFLKIVGQNPEQIIRYSIGANPLHLSQAGRARYTKPTPCPSCGSPRHFEFQLMPALLPLLQLAPPHTSDNSPVDFGTVIVATCSNSCWDGSLQEEYIFVEEDPEAHLLRQF